MKLYIAVLDDVPDYIVPTLVAHTVLSAHVKFFGKSTEYDEWFVNSYKKCVLRVNRKEFDKIMNLDDVYAGHENKTLSGEKSCIVVVPCDPIPNVLKFAKLWSPKI